MDLWKEIKLVLQLFEASFPEIEPYITLDADGFPRIYVQVNGSSYFIAVQDGDDSITTDQLIKEMHEYLIEAGETAEALIA